MTKMNFSEFKTRVVESAEGCSDSYSNIKGLTFGKDKVLQYVTGQDGLFKVNGLEQKKLNDWAFTQVAGRLNAPPISWLGKEEMCDDDLRVHILNELVEDREDAKLFMRTRNDTLRAVLSDQYTPFDNTEIIDLVETAVNEMGVDPQVFRPEVGDQLRGYVMFPQITFGEEPEGNNPGNGGLHPAVYISNSEIGGGMAKVVGAVYRSTCDNGMIYGWNSENIFAVRHRWIARAGMAEIMKNAMIIAFKLSEEAAKNFIAAQEIHIQKTDMKSIVNEWANKYGISVGAKENWLEAVTTESQVHGRKEDPRLYDVVNAATYIAQRQNTDERESMERMAGDLLTSRIVSVQVR